MNISKIELLLNSKDAENRVLAIQTLISGMKPDNVLSSMALVKLQQGSMLKDSDDLSVDFQCKVSETFRRLYPMTEAKIKDLHELSIPSIFELSFKSKNVDEILRMKQIYTKYIDLLVENRIKTLNNEGNP